MNRYQLTPYSYGAAGAPLGATATDTLKAPSLRTSISAPLWKGYALILVFIVGFGGWAAFAPLAGGAVAYGVVSPGTSRRVVQHLEGGIIRELKVRDGDVVAEGQPLVVLEPVQPRSTYEAALAQKQSLLARKARLEAERAGSASVAFPGELTVGGTLLPVAVSQREMFDARLSANRSRRDVLEQKVAQLDEQISGFNAQLQSIDTQLGYVREELNDKLKLVDQGYLAKPEALRMRRSLSELEARKSEYVTEINKAKQLIGETKLQILSFDAQRIDDITSELDKMTTELTDVDERLRASEDVLRRTTIAAPVSGTVLNLRFKTVGGVVQRGEPVLEIVPKDDALVIEARVSPNDIQLVHPGQTAQIHLDAYSSRTMPRLAGVVRSASPDRVTDARGEQGYFLARVEVDRGELARRAPGVELIPGMAAEVIFVTEERTMLQYLLKPFFDVVIRGMHEM